MNRIDIYAEALQSIANNSCCDKCQEAALVAKKALAPPVQMYAVSLEEGTEWITFCAGTGKNYNKVHAIRFEDGRIWDCVNGWRVPHE